MPSLSLTTRDVAELAVDTLIVGSIPAPDGADLAGGTALPRKAVVHLQAVLSDLEATGEVDEVHRIVAVPGVRASSVVVSGLGPNRDGFALRAAAAAGVRAVAQKSTIALALPTPTVEDLAAVADGAWSGAYRYAKATTASARKSAVLERPRLFVSSGAGQGRAAKEAVARAAIVGAARDFCRDLVNLPPNVLTPVAFVEALKQRIAGGRAKVSMTVLEEKGLVKAGCGGLIGVGQGSANPPRLVTMTWSPPKARGHIALVGKGITFDSGGVCLKTPTGMETMKSDMAGAAAAAAATLAAAELGVDVTVTAVLALAENMPSGTAQRPGDVIAIRGGTTVEIKDTDAEGRLVLADALVTAAERGPDVLLDIATLTGTQITALGYDIAALMSNSDQARDLVVEGARAAGEHVWPMPLPAALRSNLDSDVADLRHQGELAGGMLTAGLFLREFVPDGMPWAHLDIAGPSFNTKAARGTTPKGGTGWGVGTLLAAVEGHARRTG